MDEQNVGKKCQEQPTNADRNEQVASSAPQAGLKSQPDAFKDGHPTARRSRSERIRQVIADRKARGLPWGRPRGSKNNPKNTPRMQAPITPSVITEDNEKKDG